MPPISRRNFLGAATAALAGTFLNESALFAGPSGGNRTLANFGLLQQPDSNSCGPTSAAMVLRWYGINAGIERCKTKAGTRWLEFNNFKVGMTLPSGMVNCFDAFGLPVTTYKGNVDSVVRFIDQNRPPILLVRSGVKLWHWMVAIGYENGGSHIIFADPGDQSHRRISRGKLEAAWKFSADLDGNPTGGRRCSPCGGSGKLASSRVPCTNCAGSGKMISNFQVKSCGKCSGSGKINVSGGKCLVCSGSGTSPDMYRKAVESAGVSGFTMIVPTRGPRHVDKVNYTIRNDSGRTVRFSMRPSGKSYELAAGRTFTGTSHKVDGKSPTIIISATERTYKLTDGNHKFWWMKNEGRVGFDRNYDQKSH